MTAAQREVIVVTDYRVERLLLREGGVDYVGWRGLRSYFNEARSAQVMEAFSGTHPPLGAIATQCALLIRREEMVYRSVRLRRDNDRGSPVVTHPLSARLHALRTETDRRLLAFVPHRGYAPFRTWRVGDPVDGEYGYINRSSRPVLPQSWLGEFGGRMVLARPDGRDGNVFLIRRRGGRALAANSRSQLLEGRLVPHHRKLVLREVVEGSWESLIDVPR